MPKSKGQKKIMMLGAGLEHIIAIRGAQKRGLRVVAVDGSPDAPGLKVADVGVVGDIRDDRKLVPIGKKYHIDGVMTPGVEMAISVAKVARTLGLPGIDVKFAERATNKLLRIQCFEKAGMLYPRFAHAKTLKEAEAAAEKLGFPLVIKPTDNAGARGVKKIDNLRQLRESFKESLSYAKKSPVLLMEEFLQGIEISTESIIYNGKIYHTGFADRNYPAGFGPYFVEDGHSVPSTLPAKEQLEVNLAVERAIKALGINWGVAKGDILINDRGVYVLEIAARPSAGWFCAGTVPLATGVNLLEILALMSVGEKVEEKEFYPKWKKAACQRYIIPRQEGRFVCLEGVEKARKMPGVKFLDVFHEPALGEQIKKSQNGAQRYGHLIAIGDDLKQATFRCEAAISRIKIDLN